MKRGILRRRIAFVLAVLPIALAASRGGARATTIGVAPGASVQAAIDVAEGGDEILLGAGTWVEDVDFRGKAIRVAGLGPRTILHGTGAGPVVTFASGEGRASVLDGVTVTGGVAARGGGIYVSGASPTLLRNRVLQNLARSQGSGIFLGASSAELRSNLVADNGTAPDGGDPHSVEVVGGAPRIVNNTIVDGDSNGIILRGGPSSVVVNNVIAYNGSYRGGARGRGICDFSGGATIRFNVFAGNRRGALLSSDGVNYARIAVAQRRIGESRLSDNLDASPRFVSRRFGDYRLHARSRAIDRGDPSPALADRDGSRGDVGYTGGPLAPDW
jgi:nitrous oxidase accessory protein NosD